MTSSVHSEQLLFQTPRAAYVSGSQTSLDAANAIESKINRLCRMVLDAIAASPFGLTCEEAELTLGLTHQTCSARFSDLKSCEPPEIIKCRLPDGTAVKRKNRSGRTAFVYVRNQEAA